ncbi:MAG: hypothetical protein AB1547_07900 [Thermodesulfobacteriota bacterium]
MKRKKPITQEQDLVLIHYQDAPLCFARIEDISADYKPGWYHVKLLLLQVPVQIVTWILRDAYIQGEPFTMGGKNMRIEKVEVPQEEQHAELKEKSDVEGNPSSKDGSSKGGKVISLTDLKRKR